MLCISRRIPAGWPTGVTPDFPSKPDCLQNKQFNQQEQEEEEYEYLEPVPRYEYEEPHESAIQTDNMEQEDYYEPVGSVEDWE